MTTPSAAAGCREAPATDPAATRDRSEEAEPELPQLDVDLRLESGRFLVFDVEPEQDAPSANASRDLVHLIVRLTRPEDLVAEVDDQRVVLFAEVASPAALKAIAERFVLRRVLLEGNRDVMAQGVFHFRRLRPTARFSRHLGGKVRV